MSKKQKWGKWEKAQNDENEQKAQNEENEPNFQNELNEPNNSCLIFEVRNEKNEQSYLSKTDKGQRFTIQRPQFTPWLIIPLSQSFDDFRPELFLFFHAIKNKKKSYSTAAFLESRGNDKIKDNFCSLILKLLISLKK